MRTTWASVAVWLEVPVCPPKLAHALPECGTEAPSPPQQAENVHSGVPRTESASVQEGLLAGLPVAASKPPSWMTSSALAAPVDQGASTSPDATTTVPHSPDSLFTTDMDPAPRQTRLEHAVVLPRW